MERTRGGYWIKGLGIGIGMALGLLASAGQAQAQVTCEWRGKATTAEWSEPDNWVQPACGGVPRNEVPVTVIFPRGANTVASRSHNNISNLTLSGLILQGTTAFRDGWLITGDRDDPITVTGNVSVDSETDRNGFGPNILAPLKIGANVTVENLGPADLVLHDIDLNGFRLTLDNHSGIALAGTISGPPTGGLVVTGTFPNASVEFELENTYQSPTEIGGIVETFLVNPHPFGQSTTPTLVRDGTDLRLRGDLANALTLEGRATLSVERGKRIMSGDVITAPNTTLQVNTGADTSLTITGKIGPDDNASIIKSGLGTLVLSNPDSQNRFGSIVSVRGVVKVGAPGTIPDTAVVILDFDTTLDLNNINETIGPIGALGATIQLGTGTLTVNQTLQAGDLTAAILGTGTLVKRGSARLTLNMSSAFHGATLVNEGTLAVTSTGPDVTAIAGPLTVNQGVAMILSRHQIDSASPVTVNAPGLLDLTGADETAIGSLAGTGNITLGDGSLIIGADNTSTTYGGAISGAGGDVSKTGTGTLTFTGVSTYRDTQIVSGALIVNGALTGTGGIGGVFVAGGLLGGVGTVHTILSDIAAPIRGVKGANLLGATGAVSPGTGPGILHATSAFLDGLAFIAEINGLAVGTGYDQLALTGDLELSDASTLQATLGFEPAKGAQFTLISLAPGKTVNGTFNGLPEGTVFPVGDRHFSISYTGGDGNDVVVTAADDPPAPPAITYFLSEGATGGFFDEDVLIANPNSDAAPVTLTFSKENGEQVVAKQTVPAQSRLTVHVDQIPGLEATAASAQVSSDAGVPLVVERSMFWDKSYFAGSTGSAVDRPGPDWFFAEGSQGYFDTFVLVINPNATPTDVTFTFFRENEEPVAKTVTVGATTRLTLPAGDVPELVNRSFGIAVHATQPIMAERSMYLSTPTQLWSGGTASAGVTATSTHWFLAEGATGGFFDTFVLLSNPQSTPANVTLQYLLDTGDTVTVPKTIAANARLTTNIEAEDDVRLHNAAVSTVVTSDQPIIAERSMYWPGPPAPWSEGHNSFGVVDAGTKWGLAEGRVGGPLKFHTYILLANPQTTDATVKVTYLRENGTPVVQTYPVPKTSRFNIDVNAIEELQDASFGAVIEVTNGVPIVVERSLYWDSNGVQFSGGTNATGIRLP